MTRDGLADVLKKQELYAAVGATDLKNYHQRIALMEKEVGGRDKIIAKIGEANYQEYTRLSTAEKISEAMEKIKLTFIEFVKNSKLFDFITKPENVNNFIKSAVGMLAGAIDTISGIISGILNLIAKLPFTDTQYWKGLANRVSSGTSSVTGGLRASVQNLGGSEAPLISGTVQKGEQQQQTAATAPSPFRNQPLIIENHLTATMDGEVVTKQVKRNIATTY